MELEEPDLDDVHLRTTFYVITWQLQSGLACETLSYYHRLTIAAGVTTFDVPRNGPTTKIADLYPH